MPRPRKLRLAEVKIANDTLVANCAATTGSTPGQIWRRMIHSGLPPVARAASTNSISRIASACPRTSRAIGGHITKPSTRIRLRRLGADHDRDDQRQHQTRQRDEQVDDCGQRDIDRAAQRSGDQPDRHAD